MKTCSYLSNSVRNLACRLHELAKGGKGLGVEGTTESIIPAVH